MRNLRGAQRIGLLGGSFNPAHEGHVHLSIEAKRRLGLDGVLWLVSPQNPLKSSQGMADYALRLDHARRMTARDPFITVSDFEQKHGLFYSVDTISVLQRSHQSTQFVWIMGADNWANFHHWRGWREILQHIPIAIVDRAPFAHAALRQPAALSHAPYRLDARRSRELCGAKTPSWCYLFMPRHPQSATALRKKLGENVFL